MDYNRKVDAAIKLLRAIPQDGPLEISYSGGKDSDVILRLAQMAGIPHEAIYKQTSIDPPGTTAHCKEVGATILPPRKTFFQLVAEKGCPTRRARFCCEALKEYKVYDRAVQGIRRDESAARAKRYKEPEICRVYSAKEKTRVYLPILEWTLEDVARFIEDEQIKCAPVYYDDAGAFHPERRLGCIGCPMQSDCGKADYLKYPKMLKALIRGEKKYLDSHPESSAKRKYGNEYNMIFHNLFCSSYFEYQTLIGGGGAIPRKRARCEKVHGRIFQN